MKIICFFVVSLFLMGLPVSGASENLISSNTECKVIALYNPVLPGSTPVGYYVGVNDSFIPGFCLFYMTEKHLNNKGISNIPLEIESLKGKKIEGEAAAADELAQVLSNAGVYADVTLLTTEEYSLAVAVGDLNFASHTLVEGDKAEFFFFMSGETEGY